MAIATANRSHTIEAADYSHVGSDVKMTKLQLVVMFSSQHPQSLSWILEVPISISCSNLLVKGLGKALA